MKSLDWISLWVAILAFTAWGAVIAHGAPLVRELAIGDSIAVGLHLPGSAKVGISPKAVLQRIAAAPPQAFFGQIVVLSTGLSNDQSQWAYVPLQIAALKAAGAHVILLGVGKDIDAGSNNKLSELAADEDVPLIWGWSPVHPNYRELMSHVRSVECHEFKVCSA